jgi:hypothetical protein
LNLKIRKFLRRIERLLMNKNFLIPILLFCCTISLAGQNLIVDDPWQIWTGEKLPQISDSTFSTGFESRYTVDEGDFHRQWEAQGENFLDLHTWGRRSFGKSWTSSGQFGYRNLEYRDLSWVQNRNPYSGIPILLADSSQANQTLHRFWGNFTAKYESAHAWNGSISVCYAVDNGYRDQFPRAQSRHADGLISASLTYQQFIRYEISAFRFQEMLIISRYSLDQALTPTFIKIHGFDFPVVLRGSSSEERLQINQGIQHKLEISLLSKLSASGWLELSDGSADDGGAYKIAQGSWKNKRYGGAVRFRHEALTAGFQGQHSNLESRHPNLELTPWQQEERSFAASFQVQPLKAFSIWADAGTQAFLQQDLFSGVRLYLESVNSAAGVNLHIPFSHRFFVNIKVEATQRLIQKSSLESNPLSGWYFQEITAADAEIAFADCQSWRIAPELHILKNNKAYKLGIQYQKRQAKELDLIRSILAIHLSVGIGE